MNKGHKTCVLTMLCYVMSPSCQQRCSSMLMVKIEMEYDLATYSWHSSILITIKFFSCFHLVNDIASFVSSKLAISIRTTVCLV